jgi:fatty acid-binding protein DegV
MLKRGGRVNAAAAAIGNLLNIKLILHFVDGK